MNEHTEHTEHTERTTAQTAQTAKASGTAAPSAFSVTEHEVHFPVQGDRCAATLYLPDPVGDAKPPVVVMAHGLGAIRAMGLAAHAERFSAAGYACLVFDYRHFGTSEGTPRHLLSPRKQLADWAAALFCARNLSQVDGDRPVAWGTSFGGGHVISTAARRPAGLVAAIAQCPFTDGIASALAVHPVSSVKATLAGARDMVRGWLGRSPHLIATAGPEYSTALVTAPDAEPGYLGLVLPGRDFRNEVAARAVFDILRYRPGLRTARITVPTLFAVCETDSVAPAEPTLRHAARSAATRRALRHLPRRRLRTSRRRSTRLPAAPCPRGRCRGKDTNMTSRIVLLGASGYTGGLVLDAMLGRGLEPVLAGRNPTTVSALAAQHGGLDHAVADADDPATVRKLLRPGGVLVTTVGPFERYGHSPARAAVEAGAHYIDSTGEVGFVRALRDRCHDRARETGSVLLPAFGYDYVPGILAGTLAARQGGDAVRALDIGYFATGPLLHGLSQGTRATMRDGLTLPSARWNQRRLVEERTAAHVHPFTVRGRRKNAFLVSGTDVLFLPEGFPLLDAVTVYNSWFPALSRPTTVLSALADTAARHRAGR
ncbi:alpha/beta fold hydrolase [Streptomyces sp. NPDC101165]|uniref:alpha/beta fold hydrolase n=1 Tax=Streptomyces sp. NPDC101165 TaxID=3366119 RepID=UPI0038139872